MKKKQRGRTWLRLSLFLGILAAALALYFAGIEKAPPKREPVISKNAPVTKQEIPKVQKDMGGTPAEETPFVEEGDETPEGKEARPPKPEDECRQVEEGVREFFEYLDKKDYVQHLEEDIATYEHFKRMIRRLSSRLPIPAGEGIDAKIITKNIFHFFRVLEKNDLRLIRGIMRNEADTLEMNLDLFYRWLMLGDRCQDSEGIRPSRDVLYHYAGFFLNSIGGRAYLFRRPTPIRLLISYYCLLIVHEADKRGENSYGIDLYPHITPIEREIGIYPDFRFKDDYLQRLNDLSKYYLQKRQA